MVQHRKEYLKDRHSQSMSMQYGIEGYSISKHWKLDNKMQGVSNWKSRRIPAKGKYSYLDDVIKVSKQKVSPTEYAK